METVWGPRRTGSSISIPSATAAHSPCFSAPSPNSWSRSRSSIRPSANAWDARNDSESSAQVLLGALEETVRVVRLLGDDRHHLLGAEAHRIDIEPRSSPANASRFEAGDRGMRTTADARADPARSCWE